MTLLPLFEQGGLVMGLSISSLLLKDPGSSCASLLVKLRGTLNSLSAPLMLLEGKVATQSPSGVC